MWVNLREAGLATFVSLCFIEKKWYATALGDSFLFFVPKGKEGQFNDWVKLASGENFDKWISLALESQRVDLGNNPDYYSSRKETPTKGEMRIHTGHLETGTFFLMTDALAEWVLNEKEKALEEIRNKWVNQDDFEKSVATLRDSHRLGNDDSTILFIDVEDDGKLEVQYKSVEVQNLKSLIEKVTKLETKVKETDIIEASKFSKEQEISVPPLEKVQKYQD